MAGSELYKAALAYHLNLGEYNGPLQLRKYYIAFHSNNDVAEIQHTAKGTIITKQRNSWKAFKVSGSICVPLQLVSIIIVMVIVAASALT